jgi:hypothetical protein
MGTSDRMRTRMGSARFVVLLFPPFRKTLYAPGADALHCFRFDSFLVRRRLQIRRAALGLSLFALL